MINKEEKGITAKKSEDFSEWYTQVLQKAELIDYSKVSGCYIFRPRSYSIWEKVQEFFNSEIKKRGVQNAYFPLFIPESLLKTEEKHVEGFTPEVAWVTHAGDSELKERLAIRPTSETIMYDTYKNWIRSWKDLPLKINQWCNVVRWEFNNPVPFLRSREFLWQEGHTAFANKEEADEEVLDILHLYKRVFVELYAIPVLEGRKSEKEKFAGADYTTSIETFLPSGRAIQCATSHMLGQNFSKAFDINFMDNHEKKQYVWQNSWGISTRSIGIMIMMHSDDKGLVLPPRIAENKAVIVPILTKVFNASLLERAEELSKELKSYNVILDDREGYSPGWKYNEWEMKGVPVRIELGPKDMEKNQVVLVRRDTGEKEFVNMKEVKSRLKELLEEIQDNLYKNASEFMRNNLIEVSSFSELKKAIKDKKIVFMQWCGEESCEEGIKVLGAKTLNMPLEQKPSGNCAVCGSKSKYQIYVAKSY